ncbi:MAG: hypothetical protein EU529_11050 [Promethearchaeota archaeon]|nr:MAG: hypothetical protein EU529_11050 [Candidatus Lokiarchaeota archaeon]
MKPPIISPSRGPPKRAQPLIHNNVMYIAPLNKLGYIEARDAKTDELLWDLKIYDVEYDPRLERDVQEIYITSIQSISGGLEVSDECNTKYFVNLKTKKVEKI